MTMQVGDMHVGCARESSTEPLCCGHKKDLPAQGEEIARRSRDVTQFLR